MCGYDRVFMRAKRYKQRPQRAVSAVSRRNRRLRQHARGTCFICADTRPDPCARSLIEPQKPLYLKRLRFRRRLRQARVFRANALTDFAAEKPRSICRAQRFRHNSPRKLPCPDAPFRIKPAMAVQRAPRARLHAAAAAAARFVNSRRRYRFRLRFQIGDQRVQRHARSPCSRAEQRIPPLRAEPGERGESLGRDALAVVYKRALRAKIIRNQFRGQQGELAPIWETVFGDELGLTVVDNQNMSMAVDLTAGGYGQETLSLLLGGYIVPKPLGVRILYRLITGLSRPLGSACECSFCGLVEIPGETA